jgi:hypothetical protein
MTDKGRPKKYASKEEADKAAKDYQKKYLEVRRKRYKEDSEYRKKSIDRDREYYRNSTKGFVPKNFGAMAGSASKFTIDGFLNITQMALFLGIRQKVLLQWIESGRFPTAGSDGCGSPVYTVEIANKLAFILKDGLYNRGAFRSTDLDVIRELKKATNTT